MEIKYQLNEKDFEKLAVQTFKSNSSRWLWISRIIWPIVSVLTPMAIAYIKYGGIKLSISPVLEDALIGIGAVVFGEQVGFWFIKRKGRMTARGPESKVYKEFDEIKIVLTDYNKLRVTEESGVHKITKPFYMDIRETRDILVYDGGEESTLIVPKRVFQTKEEQTNFKDMMDKFIIEDN